MLRRELSNTWTVPPGKRRLLSATRADNLLHSLRSGSRSSLVRAGGGGGGGWGSDQGGGKVAATAKMEGRAPADGS